MIVRRIVPSETRLRVREIASMGRRMVKAGTIRVRIPTDDVSVPILVRVMEGRGWLRDYGRGRRRSYLARMRLIFGTVIFEENDEEEGRGSTRFGKSSSSRRNRSRNNCADTRSSQRKNDLHHYAFVVRERWVQENEPE